MVPQKARRIGALGTPNANQEAKRIAPDLLMKLAPRAGFEPATNRLTAGCSTTELPGNDARHAVMMPGI